MMEELESIAFSGNVQRSSIAHNLGVFNADMSQYMERSLQFDQSSFIDDECHRFSTGYLQDVLFQFTSKRRRIIDTSIKNCWTSNLIQNFNQMTEFDTISELKSPEDGAVSETYDSSSQKESPEKENLYCIDPNIFASGGSGEKRKKRAVAKVVYPFALVKPGGFEGDATLNDINERILMPPTRPVRHPVGDFACRPLVSPDGLGLSGKAVVAFTRIHTQGRGTITIVRTRG
ncbi:hypothetical protein SASPL_140575 [Salvia splendens]|uniref:Protein XRI1 n=1 Tax=Salvia splendens TaxID=180675 RepID=A0A8X8ZBR2_SALSN|nr:uncharacterized protein LOC121767677 isoform X1 [Salvia splendens]KAG6399101.1 hypothetical protein SASPL_140575 [Salvia splendens]